MIKFKKTLCIIAISMDFKSK